MQKNKLNILNKFFSRNTFRHCYEDGHGKLLEPVDVSRQDMDQIEDILSLFGTVKQEDIKGMT